MIAFGIILYALFLVTLTIYFVLACKDPTDIQDESNLAISKYC
jgi:hypothetical protein